MCVEAADKTSIRGFTSSGILLRNHRSPCLRVSSPRPRKLLLRASRFYRWLRYPASFFPFLLFLRVLSLCLPLLLARLLDRPEISLSSNIGGSQLCLRPRIIKMHSRAVVLDSSTLIIYFGVCSQRLVEPRILGKIKCEVLIKIWRKKLNTLGQMIAAKFHRRVTFTTLHDSLRFPAKAKVNLISFVLILRDHVHAVRVNS